jgi:GntR family transcriptional regulator
VNQVNASWYEKIQIDPESSDPLFLQVKESLARWIRQGLRDGTLSPGDRVPSENELSRRLGVSAITVKRALNELGRDGIIQRIQGRGSFIARPRVLSLGLERLYSLTTVAQERGMEPARLCLELVEMPSSANIAQNLFIAPGSPVAKIVRLRLVDDVPLAVDTSYVPLSIFPSILEDDLNRYALYDLMTSKYQVEPIRAREYLEPALINPFESGLLGVPVGSPAMLIARIAYGANEIPLEFNKSVIRGDMCRFYVDMLKENL